MKKTTAITSSLQLKKTKIANLSQEQMTNMHGGTMPQITPVIIIPFVGITIHAIVSLIVTDRNYKN